MNNFLDVKENGEHAHDFALHLPHLFWSRGVCTFRAWLMLSSPNACLIIARVCSTFSEICTKFDVVPLSDPSEISSGQIHDSK
jgi:hypothetical protein